MGRSSRKGMRVLPQLAGPLLLLLPAAAGCAAGEYATAEGAGCAPCPNGTMSAASDVLPFCPQCPYPSRCLRLGECEDAVSACCAGGSAGRGCAECERGFFSVGPKCISCPKSAGKLLSALLAAVAVIVLCLLWCATGVNLPTDDELDAESLVAVGVAHSETRAAVTDAADMSSEAMMTALTMKPSEARGAVNSVGELDEAAREAQRALSRAAKAMTTGPIFASIGLMHVHLSFHVLQLPVGFPDAVQKVAHWAAAAVSFDFGILTSPECYATKGTGALQVLSGRFLLTNAVFCGFAMALALGKLCCAEACSRQRLHSTNALTALYTLSVGALAKSCLHTFDCTHQPQLGYSTLDNDPAIVCDGPEQTEYFNLMAGAGVLGFVLYAVVLPLGLFRRLWRANQRGILGNADFLQANAWVVLKYKSSCWWFELPLLAYKLVVISASQLLNSGSEDHTGTLLLSLLAATATLLALVVLAKPFRDQFGSEGMTDADICEIVALGSVLLEHFIAWWCFTITTGMNGRELSDGEIVIATVGALLCVTVPILNLLRTMRKERQRQQQQEGGATGSSGELPTADGAGLDGSKTAQGVPSSSRVDSNPSFRGGEDS